MEVELPPIEAPRVGGPFDGKLAYCNPQYWKPNQTRYIKLHEEGIIEDMVTYSIEFPEGAVYRYVTEKKHWRYIGTPSAERQQGFGTLLRVLGLKSADPF